MNNNLGDPELVNTLFELQRQLPEAVGKLRLYGTEMARADGRYRAEKAKRIRELKSSGNPATLILDLAKGDCAEFQQEKELREIIYETQKEFINSLKIQIRVIEGQINREWGSLK